MTDHTAWRLANSLNPGFTEVGLTWLIDIIAAMPERLRHGNHPVLTACIANAVTVSDAAGNLKVDKARSRRPGMTRIDGAITTIMALGAAKTYTPPPVIDVQAMIA
jgi:Phage Terminase